MATKITIETDDRHSLAVIEQFVQFVASGLSGQIHNLAAEQRAQFAELQGEQRRQQAMLHIIMEKENDLMSRGQELDQQLQDAVQAILSEEATMEDRINSIIVALQANPSASGVEAAINLLRQERDRIANFQNQGAGGGAPAGSPEGATGGASGRTGSGAQPVSGGSGGDASTGESASSGSSQTAESAGTSAAPDAGGQ